MMNSSILSGMWINTSSKVLTLRRIPTHSICTAFIIILLKTGDRSQLMNTGFTIPLWGSSHVDSSKPPSIKSKVNKTLVQPLYTKFIKHLD